MRPFPLGPEVASFAQAMVRAQFRPSSDGTTDRVAASPSAGLRYAGARDAFARISLSLKSLSLATRFVLAAAIILVTGTVLMGSWVASRIEHAVVDNAANQLALQMETVLETVAPDLSTQSAQSALSASSQRLIDGLLNGTAAEGQDGQVVAVKIWRPDATFAYTTDHALIGRSFPMFPELAKAWGGSVTAVYNNTRRDHLVELAARLKLPLFEIYVPIRSPGSGSGAVVGVAEFYQNAAHLERELAQSKRKTWLVVGGWALAMFGMLSAIVRCGSRVIDQQRQALEARVADHEKLNLLNRALRDQLQAANRRGSEINERFLRRVSSELHDGPAQHLALVLLRLDELAPLVNAVPKGGHVPRSNVLTVVRGATADALREIRNISSGLALPELQSISPSDALDIAVRCHERATGTPVITNVGNLPSRLPLPVTICLFRFAQEGLNNAFRHAGGKGQQVSGQSDGSTIEVEVLDRGPGFAVDQHVRQSERIGLAGLRHRVESLGGSLHIQSTPGVGTRLRVRFPCSIVNGEFND